MGLEEGEGCVLTALVVQRLWLGQAGHGCVVPGGEKSERWEPCLWLGAASIPFLLGMRMLLGETLVVAWDIAPRGREGRRLVPQNTTGLCGFCASRAHAVGEHGVISTGVSWIHPLD